MARIYRPVGPSADKAAHPVAEMKTEPAKDAKNPGNLAKKNDSEKKNSGEQE